MTKWSLEFFIRRSTHLNRLTRDSKSSEVHADIHISVILIDTWIPDSSFLTSGMTKWILEFFIRRSTHLNRLTRDSKSSEAHMGIHVSVILINTWSPDSSFLTSGVTR